MIFKEVDSTLTLYENLKKATICNIKNFSKNNNFFKSRKIYGKCNYKSELIFTTYFNSKPDPQHIRSPTPSNSIDYIKPWYKSVNKLKLNGVVFHDGLSNEFIETYSTTHVRFVKCELGDFSLNDERFFIYLQYIIEFCPNAKHIFLTDGNDVVITKNPFVFVKNFKDNKLFVGRNNGNYLRQSNYNRLEMIPRFENDFGKKLERKFYNQTIYNAGILGGSKSAVIYQLSLMCYYFKLCNSSNNNNMIIMNYVIYHYWFPKCKRKKMPTTLGEIISINHYTLALRIYYNKYLNWFFRFFYNRNLNHDNKNDFEANTSNIVTSFPLCSSFKKYELNSSAYFIHK